MTDDNIDWASIPVEELEIIIPLYKRWMVRALIISPLNSGYGSVIIQAPYGGILESLHNYELNHTLRQKAKTFRCTRWVNVYYYTGTPHYYFYDTREEADDHACEDRIACIEAVIEGKEGDGL